MHIVGSRNSMVTKRDLFGALFVVLKTLASQYGVSFPAVNVNSATDADLKRLYKKLVVKVHPDKGGTADDFRNLKEAYDKWTHPPQRGWPPPPPTDDNAGSNGLVSANAENCYELRNKAAMLTYHGVQDLSQWDRMVQWLQHSIRQRSVP